MPTTDKIAPTTAKALRAAMKESGATVYRLAVDAEIAQTTLGRFKRNKSELTLDQADRLAAAMGLRIRLESGKARQ